MSLKNKISLLCCLSAIPITTMAMDTEDTVDVKRVAAKGFQHGGWENRKVASEIVAQLSSHDDIIGTRSDGATNIENNSRVGQVAIARNPSKKSNRVNCSNPNYKALCSQLVALAKPPPPVHTRETVYVTNEIKETVYVTNNIYHGSSSSSDRRDRDDRHHNRRDR